MLVRITIYTRLHTLHVADGPQDPSIQHNAGLCYDMLFDLFAYIYIYRATCLLPASLTNEGPGPSTASTLQLRHLRTHVMHAFCTL